ncbi:MAG: cation-transporting P-type ATPase [Candidatus Abawacabacteria bacterium]|nr:cation-transporting P-type ATPase [Candidatus Abawacabacteria bacterium]
MSSFSQLSPAQALTQLRSLRQGITNEEARQRLIQYGPNVLKKVGKKAAWQKFVEQFSDPMIILMIVAGLLAWFLGSTRDAVILLGIVLINAIIGFIQEYKAENVIASLQSFLTPQAKVMRKGQQLEIPAAELVPGDIVLLSEGDAVPADIRLLTINNLATNDFSLTGESNPKTKFIHELSKLEPLGRQDNQVYLGTTIARGNGCGVVYATGMFTEIGKIAAITAEVGNDASPLQKEIANIAVRLTILSLSLAGIIFSLNLLQNNPVQASLLAALGIAAAMVPQGLPAQLSVTFSLGASRLAAQKAIVKQLYSVETLGSTTIICSDKTGTITTNEMTVQHIWQDGKDYAVDGIGYEPKGTIAKGSSIDEKLLLSGALAATGNIAEPDEKHRHWYALGDPTESALVTLARKAGIDVNKVRRDWQEVQQYPFDSVRKMMSSVRKVPGTKSKYIVFLKGSLPAVLAISKLTIAKQKSIKEASNTYTEQCLRVLGMAYREIDGKELANLTMATVEQGMKFLGFVAMVDPPRVGVRDAIAQARAAHLRTFIITGDQAETAKAIAKNIGLDQNQALTIVNGDELPQLSDAELKEKLVLPAIIFARTSPEDKLRIVKLLREQGNVVAVTGDGVNDAPALKQADIGVAMGRIGTDVAKEAAEIVLTDDSYVTLVTAIKEGRTIFTNLRKTLFSTLSSNCGELTAVLASAVLYIFGYPAAIFAIHILLVDLVGEMLPLMALTFDPAPNDLMRRKPRSLNDHFLTIKNILDVGYAGLFMGGIAVFNFLWFLDRANYTPGTVLTLDNPFYLRALTLTYVTIMLGQFANILSRRHETESIFSRYFWSNPKLLGAIIMSLGLMCLVIYTPFLQPYLRTANLHFSDWLYGCLGFVGMVAAHELRKLWRRRKLSKLST